MSYNVEKTLSGLGCCALVEPEVNHLATEFFVENYNTIIAQAKKMVNNTNGVSVDASKVEDLVQDVYMSLLAAENEGNGYDPKKSYEGDYVTVAEFVFGRLKLYAKNRRYSPEGCDRHTVTKRVNGEAVSMVDFDIVYASADDNKEPEEMSSLQRAYANAACLEDGVEAVNEIMSLRQSMEFCIDFSQVVGMNFKAMFEHIDDFSGDIDNSIFDNLRDQLKYHDELSEALFNVLSSAVTHRAAFDEALSTIK